MKRINAVMPVTASRNGFPGGPKWGTLSYPSEAEQEIEINEFKPKSYSLPSRYVYNKRLKNAVA